jgi:hypothetical protein
MAHQIAYQHFSLHMDTVVHIKVVSSQPETKVMDAIHRAFEAFRMAQLENVGLDGLCILASLEIHMTHEMKGFIYEQPK